MSNKKKNIRLAIITLVAVIFVLGAKSIIDARTKSASSIGTSSQVVGESSPTATTNINKEYKFSLVNSDKKDDKIKFVVDKAELRTDIVLKGQKATAIKGRQFVVVELKLVNDKDKAFQINTRDYVRLSVNGKKDEWLAPDINNDPVEVQAISTKLTRIGFPVSTTDKDYLLQIGEINGNKDTIKLEFR